jgi:sugar phosphate permease
VTPAPALRWRVFALTWGAYAAYYLTRKDFAVAKKTLEGELGLSREALGWIDTGYLAAYAGGMFLWGLLVDRLGAKRVLVGGMLASAACAVAFGLSSTVVGFAVAFGLNGIFQCTGWPATVKVMAGWFPRAGRGAVMGVWSTNYQVGSLIANPVAAALLVACGWRAAFHGPALALAGVALLVLALLPAGPGPEEEAARPAGTTAGGGRAVLRVPLLWALGAAYFFMKLTRYVLLFWLPYYMQDALGYSAGIAATLPLAFEVGGAGGALAIGWLSDRAGGRIPVAVLALLGLALALPAYGFAARYGIGANVIALAVVGFCLFGPDSLLAGTVAQDLGGARDAGTAAGVINGLGSLGPILSGPATAIMSARFGWSAVFTALGGGALLAALVLAPWWRARR